MTRAPLVLERLLAATAAGLEPDALRAVARDVQNWEELVSAAASHGVAQVVFDALRNASVSVPVDVAKRATKLAAVQSLENELSLRALRRCLEALDAAQVEVVVLKGPLLAERLYGSALARPCLDIDLLVAERDLARATEALASVGYRAGDARQVKHELASHHHVLLFHDVYPILELHFLAYEGFGAKVPAAPLIARAAAWECKHIGPFSARVLAPEDEVVHLAIHGAGHRFERLMWVYDIALYLRAHAELTPARLVARAATFDVGRAVAATLVYVERTLGPSPIVPPPVDPAMRLALSLFGADVPPRLHKSVGSAFNLASYALLSDTPQNALRFVVRKVKTDLPRRFSKG